MKVILKILDDLGYTALVDSEMQTYIEQWLAWYQGEVKDFHSYTEYQGSEFKHNRKRYTLGMAKQVSEVWADNMYNPETEIVIGNERVQEWWDNKKQEIKFDSNFNELEELTFALGTTATVQYSDANEGYVDIDYLTHDKIYPLEVRNGEILSVAFVSKYDDDIYYVNIHERQGNVYKIYNKFFEINDESYTEVFLDNVATEFISKVKLFQIHRPAIANNKVLGSPFGLSIFANAIEELKATDIAYDALSKEVQFGKIRVYLKSGAFIINHDGREIKVLNPNQEEFYILDSGIDGQDEGQQVEVSVPQLRQVLIDFLNTQLNLVGRKCGLGDNAFSFSEGTIYTNTTQVVSTNSKFYKTRQKHGTVMEENIIDIIKGLYWLEFKRELTAPISVHMDDSILHDKDEELNRVLQFYDRGIVSKEYVISIFNNMTLEEAKAFLKEQEELLEIEEELQFEE